MAGIRNEDQLKSLYDRVMSRTAKDDWAEAIEQAQEEKRKAEEEALSDKMEQIFGVR